jgi:hypothetical protein
MSRFNLVQQSGFSDAVLVRKFSFSQLRKRAEKGQCMMDQLVPVRVYVIVCWRLNHACISGYKTGM